MVRLMVERPVVFVGRGSQKLTDRTVRSLKEPGRYGDGLGLWLQISKSGTKSWIFRYMIDGKARMMGLGSALDVSLAEAREKAAAQRKLLKDKEAPRDPIAERTAKVIADRLAKVMLEAKAITFRECAAAYVEAHRAGWKNEKHAQQWQNTLATYANPVFGSLPVSAVDTALVMKCLEPIWTTKTETATRLRGRIESVLGWATVRGYRTGDNPARWKGHLDNLLASPNRAIKIRHHAALPYASVGEFIKTLREMPGVAALALEFAILTAARTGEVIGATWKELDPAAGTWIVPAERMKAKKEHLVALSKRAIEIAEAMRPLKIDDDSAIFANKGGKGLSNMALLAVLKRMERPDLTVHGFRSTFRDWAGETTSFPREVIEHALAHQLNDKAEAAYARGTLLAKRRRLMEEWATYCGKAQPKGAVVPLQKRAL